MSHGLCRSLSPPHDQLDRGVTPARPAAAAAAPEGWLHRSVGRSAIIDVGSLIRVESSRRHGDTERKARVRACNAELSEARFPFKRNRLRCVHCVNENRKKRKSANRNARSKQWQPWLAACKRKRFAFFAVFVYATHATQAIAFEWKPGLTDCRTNCRPIRLAHTRLTTYTYTHVHNAHVTTKEHKNISERRPIVATGLNDFFQVVKHKFERPYRPTQNLQTTGVFGC